MKNKSDAIVTKGIIFAGCSFTWGQGLYYYSNLSTLKEPPPNCYYPELVDLAHIEFMKSVRYPRLVANYFNTFELVQTPNGGSCESIAEWWDSSFTDGITFNGDKTPRYEYSDISHLTFQMTHWHRNTCTMNFEGVEYKMSYTEAYRHRIFDKWLTENNLTLEEWEYNGRQANIDNIKNFLQIMESHGVGTTILTWPIDNVEFIKKDSWLNERFMPIVYKDSVYNSMEDLIIRNNELKIDTDYENFDTPPRDHHPSLKCHRVMAQNIIRYLERKI